MISCILSKYQISNEVRKKLEKKTKRLELLEKSRRAETGSHTDTIDRRDVYEINNKDQNLMDHKTKQSFLMMIKQMTKEQIKEHATQLAHQKS